MIVLEKWKFLFDPEQFDQWDIVEADVVISQKSKKSETEQNIKYVVNTTSLKKHKLKHQLGN